MHSKLLCLISVILFADSFVYAGQPEIDYHGTFYLYSFFWQNADFLDDFADGDQFYYLHGDVGVDADFGADVSTNIKVGGWGIFGKHPITGEESEHGTPGQNVEVREAYITLANLFDTPISFRAGKEHILYGEQVFDGGEDGATGIKLFVNTDVVDADFFWYRLIEGGGCWCIGRDTSEIVPDDLDLFGTWIVLKFMEGAVKIAPYGFYRMYAEKEDGITFKDEPMWGGVRLDAAPIPGLYFAGEFTRMFGSQKIKDNIIDTEIDYTGMHYMARLSYMPQGIPVSFGGAYVSLSGDDDLTDDEYNYYESPIWGPYTFGFYKRWPGFGPAHLTRSAFGFALTMPPRFPLTEDQYSRNLNVINGHLGFRHGPFMLRGDLFKYTKNAIAEDLDIDTDMGMEIAVIATYTYQNRIILGATGGYWTPGEYFETIFGENLDPMLGGYIFTYISF